MNSNEPQIQLVARALYEIRLLLAPYLGSNNPADRSVREAAHLSYALHNEAMGLVEGKSFDMHAATAKLRTVDSMFGSNFVSRLCAGAAPNGGPAASVVNPRSTDGPPSVS